MTLRGSDLQSAIPAMFYLTCACLKKWQLRVQRAKAIRQFGVGQYSNYNSWQENHDRTYLRNVSFNCEYRLKMHWHHVEKVRMSPILNLWEHFTKSWKSCVSGATAVKLGAALNKKCTFVVMAVDNGINCGWYEALDLRWCWIPPCTCIELVELTNYNTETRCLFYIRV